MPFYQKNGETPDKRHIQFRNKDGDLYWEELISREGFSDIYSNVYHLNPPTAIKTVGDMILSSLDSNNKEHQHHHQDDAHRRQFKPKNGVGNKCWSASNRIGPGKRCRPEGHPNNRPC